MSKISPMTFPLPHFLPEANSNRTIHEPPRQTTVLTECDVAVFGGGPAGVCAAAAAARRGKRVVLVERHGFLGGMATAANVNIWHSLYGTDHETLIIGGLPEEIIRRLQKDEACYNGSKDGETGHWVICSENAKFVFDDVVVGSGVRLLFHTWLVDVQREGGRITAAFVENKSGRHAIVASTYIDCTGDADLVRRAGAPTQIGDADGNCQPPTLCFRVGGIPEDAMPLREMQHELYQTPMAYNGEHYPAFLWGTRGIVNKDEYMLAGVRVLHVNAAKANDFTRAEVEGRYQLRWVMEQLRSHKGWEHGYLNDVATQIGIRESHRIVADHQLTRDELLYGHRFADTIAQGTYPIDIHNPDGPGIIFEQLSGIRRSVSGDRTMTETRWDGAEESAPKRDTLCWSVPYRSLLPRDLDNVLAAGRCIGANHDSAGGIRVMINAMQFGQAAGTAAAMATNGAPRTVSGTTLRDALMADGVPLLPVDNGAGAAAEMVVANTGS